MHSKIVTLYHANDIECLCGETHHLSSIQMEATPESMQPDELWKRLALYLALPCGLHLEVCESGSYFVSLDAEYHGESICHLRAYATTQ